MLCGPENTYRQAILGCKKFLTKTWPTMFLQLAQCASEQGKSCMFLKYMLLDSHFGFV